MQLSSEITLTNECVHTKRLIFTPKAYKHTNGTIDDVKVSAKCLIRELLRTTNLRTKQAQDNKPAMIQITLSKKMPFAYNCVFNFDLSFLISNAF